MRLASLFNYHHLEAAFFFLIMAVLQELYLFSAGLDTGMINHPEPERNSDINSFSLWCRAVLHTKLRALSTELAEEKSYSWFCAMCGAICTYSLVDGLLYYPITQSIHLGRDELENYGNELAGTSKRPNVLLYRVSDYVFPVDLFLRLRPPWAL